MLRRDRKGIRTAQSDHGESATTAWRCNSDDRVLELRNTPGHGPHGLTVGRTNVVPGSRIFTAGCSGWFSRVALSRSIASNAVDVT